VKSTRALVAAMSASVLSETGASRWCETSFAGERAAQDFLLAFPEATFICVHRSLSCVLGDAATAYPWGLAGSPFWRYAGPHPGNNVATIAAFWVNRTASLLSFEERNQDACLRVVVDDSSADHLSSSRAIFAALSIDTGDSDLTWSAPHDESRDGQGTLTFAERPVPTQLVPAPLLAQIQTLHSKLNLRLEPSVRAQSIHDHI
jgi:hypothetical protein